MNAESFWTKTYVQDISGTPKKIWDAFVDITHWRVWNPGVASVQMEGDFVTGTWFTMELPDGAVIRSQLTDVSEGHFFIDETWLDETMIRVEHRIQASHSEQTQVAYIISAFGPGSQDFGEAVSEDFPEVLEGLENYLDRPGA